MNENEKINPIVNTVDGMLTEINNLNESTTKGISIVQDVIIKLTDEQIEREFTKDDCERILKILAESLQTIELIRMRLARLEDKFGDKICDTYPDL